MDPDTLMVDSVYTFDFYNGEKGATATFKMTERNILVSEKLHTLYTFLYKKNMISLTEDYLLNLDEESIKKIR